MEQSMRKWLFDHQDPEYRLFCSRLMPTVDPDTIIGVRTPVLRTLAKGLSTTPEAEAFLGKLPHTYYEENNLHGYLIALEKDYDRALSLLEEFLPYINNWATCDLLSPKVFRRHRQELLEPIDRWMHSDHTYTVRFGIGMLMSLYLDAYFRPEYLNWVTKVRSEEYYIRMMIAWYFATALTKQYEAALPYIEERRLDPWVHNKAIQKAVESRRISEERKSYLRNLKWHKREI